MCSSHSLYVLFYLLNVSLCIICVRYDVVKRVPCAGEIQVWLMDTGLEEFWGASHGSGCVCGQGWERTLNAGGAIHELPWPRVTRPLGSDRTQSKRCVEFTLLRQYCWTFTFILTKGAPCNFLIYISLAEPTVVLDRYKGKSVVLNQGSSLPKGPHDGLKWFKIRQNKLYDKLEQTRIKI